MKPDLTDQELDAVLSELETPEHPAGLTARIMAALPERKPGWRRRLLDLFGLDRLAIPAAGAFASLAVGVLAGYALTPITAADLAEEEAETALALAFGTDTWLDITEETGQ